MPSKRTHDVVATVGEYQNGQGETKKRYVTIGSAFTDDQSRVSIKLDAIPVSNDWSNWLSLYPVKDRDDRESDRRQPTTQSRSQQAVQQKGWTEFDKVDDSDSIPF